MMEIFRPLGDGGMGVVYTARDTRLDRTVAITTQLAHALDAAPTERLFHRDVKPANIFVTDPGQARLLNLGWLS